ncbi:hypothetical protein A3D80_04090 [Candidatus Roizmanbacteria bacterium RIFCSPHIGHO2_02_FULL_40_13b]|uniref:Uncharacterized protein n=1 Tax=Candidatus Roizmanbacteria bacterium RIFCSPHIGHO2_01_FULL_39_24 TaxID=1802032 RepID=A0A1F7GKJ8_9BACT|nr:MAG: hypothetical protein A2799_00335 [Candidatus Roizmanbacteria bacterium RIFCSPHIGHO2_01_FULL_39_24]OGK27973.1 MAG: hypothetical protein A3D80_04090 [Candidatus Roizmanbacteria bacterium RIFCSPHIGHO2_02_FULL_40_13b]OGK49235.1 MAG: hypothetical protein A3A56_04545 [Candidatus Roizmanbacteria bacterium RIFCSPLOWO2_01_FULL_40_32]
MASKKGGLLGIVMATLAGTAAVITASFFSKKSNRTKTIRAVSRMKKQAVAMEKKMMKASKTKKTGRKTKARKITKTRKK